MAQTLRLKRSSVPGRVPTTATLQTGEIAINTADGLVYIRKDDDTIIPLLGANTVVTGSITLLGSVEATSFTGSFSGSADGLRGVVLDYSASAGDGMLAFTYNGSADAIISLDTGSDHFVNAVVGLIDSNAPSIIAQDTTGAGGIDLSYNSDTGALSGSLVYNDIQLGYTSIQLGGSAASVTDFNLENTKSTGSFSGSFTGQLEGTSSWAENAITASYVQQAETAISSSYTSFATSASYADLATTASYAVTSTSASYASTSTSASHALIADFALAANVESGSFLTTGSVADNIVTLTKVDGTSFDLPVDNVPNAISASHADSTTSASYATFAETANSASHAINSDNAISASYATFAETSNSASYATFAEDATSASYAEFTAFAQDAISASYAATASSANDFLVRGDLNVQGTVTAKEFHTEFVSASIVFSSGSTKFGDTPDDTHEFTGSVLISGSIDSDDITINDWGSVSASLALLNASSSAVTLQDVTDNGASTTLAITASNLNINGFPDVSASLAGIQSANNLQGVTDNGNVTTNEVIISSSLQVSSSVYSKGEEVLDFAVAMAIALG